MLGSFADQLALVPDMPVDFSATRLDARTGLPTPIVVSLLRRPDRWAAAQAALAGCHADGAMRAPAVDGRDLSSALLGQLLEAAPDTVDETPGHYLHMTRPAVGCFLSHLALWNRFLASDAPFALIMEDDAVPAKVFSPERAASVMRAFPPDADIVLLGGTIMDGLAAPSPYPGLMRTYYYNGTYAYLLTRKGCRALLPHLLPIKTHIDNQISLALVEHHQTLAVYCVEPRLFEHDFSVYSDVYVPVADAAVADHRLDAVFKASRARLQAAGVNLLPMHGQ
jgi:GR25 family glycosyltransferase involved in LPS biosynthesis